MRRRAPTRRPADPETRRTTPLPPEIKLSTAERQRAMAALELRLAILRATTVKVKLLLTEARALGLSPSVYANTLQSYWNHRAAEAAGIDLDAWDPTQGAAANRKAIEAVYTYYGSLYLNNPDLQWAGMANMIGPSFAAGFFDINQFRTAAEKLADIPEPLRSSLPPGITDVANMPAADLKFYETLFLNMQKKIFLDQGTMHQAYLDGGLGAINEMRAAGLLDAETTQSWVDIDSGDPERVKSGNTQFLLREQRDIINVDYQRMYSHMPTGPAMTYIMTQIGEPSIPGARGYAEVFPATVTVTTLGPERLTTPDHLGPFKIPHLDVDNPAQFTATVQTPLASGNIANFEDRWNLISEDTLPAYQRLLAEDPEQARDIIASNVHDRIGDYRLSERVNDIIKQLTNWKIDVEQ